MAKFMLELKNAPLEIASLNNTDRELLRSVAEPGMPLWKILRSMVDYGNQLRDGLVVADFDDESQRAAIRRVQAIYQATQWVIETFEAAMTDAQGNAPVMPSEEETNG